MILTLTCRSVSSAVIEAPPTIQPCAPSTSSSRTPKQSHGQQHAETHNCHVLKEGGIDIETREDAGACSPCRDQGGVGHDVSRLEPSVGHSVQSSQQQDASTADHKSTHQIGDVDQGEVH